MTYLPWAIGAIELVVGIESVALLLLQVRVNAVAKREIDERQVARHSEAERIRTQGASLLAEFQRKQALSMEEWVAEVKSRLLPPPPEDETSAAFSVLRKT